MQHHGEADGGDAWAVSAVEGRGLGSQLMCVGKMHLIGRDALLIYQSPTRLCRFIVLSLFFLSALQGLFSPSAFLLPR